MIFVLPGVRPLALCSSCSLEGFFVLSASLTRGQRRLLIGGIAAVLLAAGIILPGTTASSQSDGRPRVITTTGILADLAQHVAGEDAIVEPLLPPGADPHSYEPTPRAARDVARADLALSNYLMLEEQSLIRMIDANLAPGAEHLALAEEASTRGAELIPLVENRSLDSVWLGLRVIEDPSAAKDRTAQTRLRMTGVTGPGALHAYVTGTFGTPQSLFDSSDGVDDADETLLPQDAHTHVSWAFTEAGVQRMTLEATRAEGGGARLRGDVVIAVGSDPRTIPELAKRRVVDSGHADITADFATGRLALRVDSPKGPELLGLDEVVIHVPPRGLLPVPSDPAFRFIAKPGTDVYQLPQAVLGRHVHGEIDPHLWHDVTNAQAYVEVIRDHLIKIDPSHAAGYRSRADAYLRDLDDLDAYMADATASIPEKNRHLVTTHDAYGYLAARYGLDIAGTVSPSPGQEPSIADRRRLASTLRDLKVPAVFVEGTAGRTADSLRDAAELADVKVCPIWGDAYTRQVTDYDTLVRANADSLARCLGGKPAGNHDRL